MSLFYAMCLLKVDFLLDSFAIFKYKQKLGVTH